MPSAKIVTCDRFPPENMSYRPNMRVLAAWSATAASAAEFTPGVGMWWPTRYTPSSPSVNSTRLRRSETVKMFFRLIHRAYLIPAPSALRHSTSVLPPAAAIFSAALPLNLCARTVSALPISPRAEHLHAACAPPTRPCSRSSSGVTTVPASNRSRERVEVDDLVLDAERVVEPALRHAAVQRHLAAFEPALVA